MKSQLYIFALVLGLIQSSLAATIIQSFSNNSVGTLSDGSATILNTNPNFSVTDINTATQLDIVLTLTGDAHKFIQSLDSGGRQHAAQILTQVAFGNVNTSSALFLGVNSLQLASLTETPFISGNGSGDTSSVFPSNPMSYIVTWNTTDTSLIAGLNGSSLDFQALPSHTLGSSASFNELFGGATYSNLRLQDVGFQVDYRLTTVPEPSGTVLLGSALSLLAFRRKR